MRVYKVILTEYERGWNSKVFDELYFKKEENALSYIKEYNSKNNLSTTPEYYTKADYSGVNIVPDNFKLEDAEFEITGVTEFINLTYEYDGINDVRDYCSIEVLDLLIEQDICSKEKLIQFREHVKQAIKELKCKNK